MKNQFYSHTRLILLLVAFSLRSVSVFSQTTIKGKVTDAKGQAVAGANIAIKGKTIGTSTDSNGSYVFETNKGDAEIVASSVGYTPVTKQINIKEEETIVDFVLTEDFFNLSAVVVTGTATRSRKQKEMSGSLTQLSAKQLQNVAGFSLADILRTVPGVQVENGGGEVGANVFVRGLPAGGQYKYTPIEEDGMPVQATGYLTSSGQDIFFRPDLGIQSLEFARGGSSVLFGNGAPMGVLNYISKKGNDKPETTIKTIVGTQGLARLDFNTSGPMGDNWKYNLSGFVRYDAGPIITGLTTQGYQIRGNVTRTLENGYIRASLRTLNDQDQYFLPVPHNVGTYDSAIGNNGKVIKTLNSAEAANFSVATPNGTIMSKANTGVTAKGTSFMLEFVNNYGNDWNLQAKIRLTNFDHKFDFFSPGQSYDLATYSAKYGGSGTYTYADNGQPLDMNTSTHNSGKTYVTENSLSLRNRPLTDYNADLRVTKKIETDAVKHNITFGSFGSITKQLQDEWGTTFLSEFNDQPRLVDLTVVDNSGKNINVTKNGYRSGLASRVNNSFEADRLALYLGDEMKINRLRIDLGIRQEWLKGIVIGEKTALYDNPNSTSLADAKYAWGTGKFVNRTLNFNDFSYVIGANYELSNSTNLYGSFTKGVYFPEMRTFGNLNMDGKGNFIQVAPTKNETVYQSEIGVKYGSHRLSGTAALYHITILNRLQNDAYQGPDGVLRDIVNSVGSSTTTGIESSLAYIIIPGLTADANLTFQDHQYDKYVKNLPGADGIYGNADDTKINYQGNWVLRQPRAIINTGLSYDKYNWEAGVNYTYTGKRYADDQNNILLPEYSIINLRLARLFAIAENQSLIIGGSIYNTFNTQGLTEGDPRVADTNTLKNNPFYNARPVLPRRVMFTLTFKF
jgi:iron complex outermembrane receptor protein